jgi:antitoxin (DNA-binding transcriptional repressor) of toxin-antitoxin stability system
MRFSGSFREALRRALVPVEIPKRGEPASEGFRDSGGFVLRRCSGGKMIVHVENVTPELSALIERYLAGEPIVFLKNGKPLLEFSSAAKETPTRRSIGFFGCEIDMSSFDDPLEEMEPYE